MDSINVAIRIKPAKEGEDKIWHYDDCNIMQAYYANGKPIQNPNVYTFGKLISHIILSFHNFLVLHIISSFKWCVINAPTIYL